jgi:hypothetical protein
LRAEVVAMTAGTNDVTMEQAADVAARLGIDLEGMAFDLDQFRRGMQVELEHGRRDPETDVTGDDPLVTGKIALAHLREYPDYYDRLEVLEAEAEAHWSSTR